MSRQTLAETLKGGTLLLGVLMILLAIAGGLLKLVMGDAPKGPEYRVQVKIDPGAARPPVTAAADSAPFAIPAGAVDVVPATHLGLAGLPDRPGRDAAALNRAGFKSQDCRTFAIQTDRGATVTACMSLFDSAAGAFSIYASGRPNPDSMAPRGFDRGYVTPDGFNIVKGRACFEIRRSDNGEAARQLAMNFIDGLAAMDFGPGLSGLLSVLPGQGMIPGTERLFLATDSGGAPVVSARYRFENTEVTGSISVMESEQAAAAATDAAAADLVARGAVRETIAGAPRGTWFFVYGQLPVAVGSAGNNAFRIDGTAGITSVVMAATAFTGADKPATR